LKTSVGQIKMTDLEATTLQPSLQTTNDSKFIVLPGTVGKITRQEFEKQEFEEHL